MFQQLQLNFVLVLYMRLFLESHAVSDICSICTCHSQTNIDCSSRGLTAVPKPIPPTVEYLDLSNNRIQYYEDRSFLFLPRINYIDLRNNTKSTCECYFPAFVNYMKSVYSKTVDVKGECLIYIGNNQKKVIPLLEHSECIDYPLFKKDMECQTCSGTTCNDSEKTNCGGDEPVCRIKLSMNGIKPKFERSCSTYRECVAAMRSNAFTCNNWTSDSPCFACCIGYLCNTNDFIGWSNSFVFHLIFNSTLNNFNEHENISRVVDHELSNLKGAFEVQYCCSVEDTEVFTITCTVPRTITKDLALKQILETLKTSQTLRDLGFQQGDMNLFDERVCYGNTTTTSDVTFYWPTTKIGNNATIPCHANVATRYCSANEMDVTSTSRSFDATSPTCLPGFYVQSPNCSPLTGIWQQPDMSQCNNTQGITQQLKNITNEVIDKENVEKVSAELRDISKKSVYFKEQDIDLAVDIHEKMVPLISNMSANLTVNNILPSINDIINTPEEVLVEAEQSERTAKRMLKIIEAIPDKIPLEGHQITVVYSNLGIGVIKVDADTFNGAFYGVSYGNNENETKTMVYDHSHSNPQVDDTVDMIALPKNLLEHLKEENRSAVSRISFISMQDDKLYRVIRDSEPGDRSKIISNIIAANIPNIPVTNLSEPINISFHLKDQDPDNLQCVYWDESPGQSPNWSPRGCNTSEDGGKVLCSCNHLTSFAVLKEIYLEICSSSVSPNTSCIGCAISLGCLILTVIIHICFKKLRKSMSSKILINLCISLAITNLILLIGMQPYASKTIASCKTVAALFHYFLLTSAMWMAIEAFHIYLNVTPSFKIYQTSFLVKSSISAWGLPAVIVAITLAINYTNNYIRIGPILFYCHRVGEAPSVEQIASGVHSFCWLSKIPFYASFLAPMVIILFFNCTMICLVIWRLISVKCNKLFEHKTIKLRVGGIFGLISLSVLCCVLAFFQVKGGDMEFRILFPIFNALLGIFILIFYCICTKDIKDAICFRLCRRKKRNDKQSCKQPMNVYVLEDKQMLEEQKPLHN